MPKRSSHWAEFSPQKRQRRHTRSVFRSSVMEVEGASVAGAGGGKAKATQRDNEEMSAIPRLIPGVDGKRAFGFPNKIITKLRYAFNLETGALTNTVGVDQVFAMNSVFDPDVTNAGHQPMWFDTYASVYKSYRVIGSKLSCTFTPSAYSINGTYAPWIVGVTGNTTSTALLGYTTAQELMETADTSYRTIKTDGQAQIFLTFDPEGQLAYEASDDVVSVVVTASPSRVYYGHCWVFQENAFGTPATTGEVKWTGHIDYTVEFYDLKNPTAS